MMTAEGGTGQLEAASLGTSPAARSMSALFHTHGNKHKHACAAHTTKKATDARCGPTTSSTLIFFSILPTSLPHSTLKNYCGFFVVLVSFFLDSTAPLHHHTDDAQSIREDDPCTLSRCLAIYFHFFSFRLAVTLLFGSFKSLRAHIYTPPATSVTNV